VYDETPAARHRQVAADFTKRVRGVPDWDAPAPPAGWLARDVVRHLVDWSTGFLGSGAAVPLSTGPRVDDDPASAWEGHCAAVQALLDDARTAAADFHNPHVGRMRLDEAVDRFYTTDVFLHTWDLARASGQDERLDPDECAALYRGMLPYDEALRSSGHYGPKVPVCDDADPQTKLLAFIGRHV